MRVISFAAAIVLLSFGCGGGEDRAGGSPGREEVLQALGKAVDFYANNASLQGAYHFSYAEDLSYGRSEHAEGPTTVEYQREGTPSVALAYLTAYDATREPRFLEAARESAHAVVKGQLCSGGWDYYVELDPEERKKFPYRADGNCDGWLPKIEGEHGEARRRAVTNLDDNVTQAALRVLMRVDRELDHQDEAIHEALEYALEGLMRAQYPNGAWPQRYNEFPDPKDYPVKRASYPESWSWEWPGPDYQQHYTFNDNSIVDMIDAMLEAARIYNEPRYLESAIQGGEFILLAQMPDPQPGWAQQYDRDMHPAWARIFEPPSVTGGESQGVMQMLLTLYRETGDKKYLEPLDRALTYYESSELPPVENPSEIRRRACPPGSICLARFAELQTNKPLYVTKGTRVNVASRSSDLLDGYELSYSDESVITHYGVLVRGDRLPGIREEYERLKTVSNPAELRRPDKLWGLSPWTGAGTPTGAQQGSQRDRLDAEPLEELSAQVRKIIQEMDERGAWVQEGYIGRSDRVIQLFSREDMVVTVNGNPVLNLTENDTLQIFRGETEPAQRILRSQTFANNVEALSAYLRRTAE